MQIIEPGFEVIFHMPEGFSTVEQFIESVARTCYKSEDRITETSAPTFISKTLMTRKHMAMVEHCVASVRFIADRGFTHELVRHRLASFAQECVSGDTEVKKGMTIKQLYDRKSTPHGKTHNKTIRLSSVDDQGVIIKNKIVDVFLKGRAYVYRVSTKLGYKIKATMTHKFQRPDSSFSTLSELKVGDPVMVNGRPSLLASKEISMTHLYLECGYSPQEMADYFGVSYSSVLSKLKKMGVFQKHLNDKDVEKYNKNHTPDSYKKASETILGLYRNGRTVWNKGVLEKDSDSVKRQADSLREHHHGNQVGGLNSNWKGGRDRKIAYALKEGVMSCELCDSLAVLEVHHKDSNPANNSEQNLVKVCVNCHNKLHHGWHIGLVSHPDIIESIEYVGEEETYDIEMMAPYHNYVANGFVVHNSTRYCNYSKGKFGGEIRVLDLPVDVSDELMEHYIDSMKEYEKRYLRALELGAKPEIARMWLPEGLKAEIVMTANLREWKTVFGLRADPAAHPMMRNIMVKVQKEFAARVPCIFGEAV